MSDYVKRIQTLKFKDYIQLFAGLLFLVLGVFILITNFENNYILKGSTKYLFGSILGLYGLVRITRVYQAMNRLRKKSYEDEDSF